MSVVLNGSDQYLEGAAPTLTDHPYTLVAWVKPDGTSTIGTPASMGSSSVDEWVRIVQESTTGGGQCRPSTTATLDAKTQSLSSATWQLMVVTHFDDGGYTGNRIDSWVDTTGDNDSVTQNEQFPDLDNIAVGRLTRGTSKVHYFDGKVGYVCVADVQATSSDITDLYTNEIPPHTVFSGNVLFDARLVSDNTVTVGSPLTEYNSPIYDEADNPPCHSAETISIPAVLMQMGEM